MKTDLQILIETYGCKDLADLKRCFIDNAMSLSMIQEAMRAYREQGEEWVKDSFPVREFTNGFKLDFFPTPTSQRGVGTILVHPDDYEAMKSKLSPPKQKGMEG